MKTERVTLLTTPAFKSFLAKEAKREKVSVAQLVRQRCEGRGASTDEAQLRALTSELRAAVGRAQLAMDRGIAAAEGALSELRAKRRHRP